MTLNRRGTVGMEGLDGFQTPRLPLLALLLGPDDRLPVRRQNQPRTGIGDLDPVTAGLVNIKKKCLLDRVLVRTGLDVDGVLQKDIGGTQDVFAAVERIGEMVEAAGRSGMIARISEVVALVRDRHPHRGFRAVVEHDLLGQAAAEICLEEYPVSL